MPIPIIGKILTDGLDSIPYVFNAVQISVCLGLLFLIKRFFGGAVNKSDRVMHGKVIILTGGTSGIGAEVARDLASRGAQLVLLTQHVLSDPFLVEYIMDLRRATDNDLITAEHCDLASLHSIRQFATRWVDNAPPRRLDAIVLCASTLTPPGIKARNTADGLEENWGINYVANFHLLSILSPAIRIQPPDRDVRVIFATCSSYVRGELPSNRPTKAKPSSKTGQKDDSSQRSRNSKSRLTYATSKLALMTFAAAFQKHLSEYKRPDSFPMNTRVIVVDPGWTRSPGMRRYLTFGSLWGLLVYLVTYPLWWAILKSPIQGSQSFSYAALDMEVGRSPALSLIRECDEFKSARVEVHDPGQQELLWSLTSRTIEALEKEGATERARKKKDKERGSSTPKSAESITPEANTSANANAERKPNSRRSRKEN